MDIKRAFELYPKAEELYEVGSEIFLKEEQANSHAKHFNLGKPTKHLRSAYAGSSGNSEQGTGSSEQGTGNSEQAVKTVVITIEEPSGKELDPIEELIPEKEEPKTEESPVVEEATEEEAPKVEAPKKKK